MNSVLDKNLQIISKYNEELVRKISSITELVGEYEIKEAKSGDNILFKGGRSVDNNIDPIWDAVEKFNGLKDKSVKSITVIYGLGLGYILKEFSKRLDGKIIIYEPDLELLRISLEIVDFSEEFKNSKIILTNTFEDIENAYSNLFFVNYKLNIICSDYYLEDDLQNLKKLKSKIEETHGIYQSNYSNAIKKSTVWTKALIENILSVLKNPDLHVLKDKFKGKPAVIISAGPSLDKNIQDIKPYRDSVIVFCVGTAFKAAVKHGIIPDFVVVIETSFLTKIQIDLPELEKVNVIVGTNTFKGVFDLKPASFFNYHSNKTPAAKNFGEILGVPINLYETAGTVSIISLYAAKMLGCDKIILIGQDLAYTDNNCYSENCIYGAYKLNESKEIGVEGKTKIELQQVYDEDRIINHSKILNKDLCQIKGQNGKTLITRPDFLLFSKYYEEIARKYSSEIKLVNSTEGGAFLEGFEHISLREALEKYSESASFNVNSIVRNHQWDLKDFKKRKKIVRNTLTNIIKNYNSIKSHIVETKETGFISNLSDENAKIYEELKSSLLKFHQLKNKTHLDPDEKKFIKERTEKNKLFYGSFDESINELFNEDIEKFKEKLNILQKNYIKIKSVIEHDFFLRNMVMGNILLVDNAIKDFRKNDENLLDLYKKLCKIFIKMDFAYPFYIEKIKKNLEQLN